MTKTIDVKEKPLVFVQHATGDKFTVYQDGKEVRGIRSIRIDAGAEEFTTHEIEYLTGATAEEKWTGRGETSRWIFEDSPQKSANELRKQAIEEAKEFVEDNLKYFDNGKSKEGGNATYRNLATKPEFVINEDKRTVVAIVRGIVTGNIYEKGVAKCDPSDVFNVDLGKAIALGRAYGLDVSEFEQAPQPDEVVVGMKVEAKSDGTLFQISKLVNPSEVIGGDRYGIPFRFVGEYGWLGSNQVRITSDTEAQY